MSSYNSEKYTSALLSLIQISDKITGPTSTQVKSLKLSVPKNWLEGILSGWHNYAVRYERPYFPELGVAGKPVRFLRIGLLPPMKLAPKPYCTLCGLSVKPPRRSWHKECIEAFLPYTHRYWKNLCRGVVKRDKKCVSCGLVKGRGKKIKGETAFEYDHITPVGMGGQNVLENIQLLCVPCHRLKTKTDVKNIILHKASAS